MRADGSGQNRQKLTGGGRVMEKRRKPRGPMVDREALEEWKKGVADQELVSLSFRFEILETMREAGTLNTRFIALEALGALASARESGRPEEALRSCWPKDWGDNTLNVPLSLLLALRDGWTDYKNAYSGKSLGEALKIEGGGQGAQPMKVKLANIDRARALANAVEARYQQIEQELDAISLVEAYTEVAIAHGVSPDTVKNAHKDHAPSIRREMFALGLLKGEKTSGSDHSH